MLCGRVEGFRGVWRRGAVGVVAAVVDVVVLWLCSCVVVFCHAFRFGLVWPIDRLKVVVVIPKWAWE